MYNNFHTATLAGGCFWCLEAVLDEIKVAQRLTEHNLVLTAARRIG